MTCWDIHRDWPRITEAQGPIKTAATKIAFQLDSYSEIVYSCHIGLWTHVIDMSGHFFLTRAVTEQDICAMITKKMSYDKIVWFLRNKHRFCW